MKQRKRKREPSAPGRGGKLAAASRCPLHYPQGGFHSLIPFPLNHFTFPIPIPCPSEFRNEYGDEIRSFNSKQSERPFARDAGY